MKKIIYTSLLFILIASCSKDKSVNNSNSSGIEVNHHDWNPDTLVVDSILIDLNNDNLNDLKFLIEKDYQGTSPGEGNYYNYFAKCISINSNLKVSLGTAVHPDQQNWNCLELNDLIFNDLTWSKSFILKGQVIGAGGIGIWDKNNAEGYIGLKLKSNGMTNFGWIKVNVDYNTSIDKHYKIICYEYAISELNNSIIKAGQIE